MLKSSSKPQQAQQQQQNSSISGSQQNNVFNSIMNFLPDNRPITSLQIVEDYEKCPKNFIPINKTYDQDSDADLWRETSKLFGKQTKRYLCLGKCGEYPEYVVESLKILSEKQLPPKEFSLIYYTSDTKQKAWRKKHIIYKLSERSTVTNAITDVILCSKLKTAPNGFTLAGEINGILVCYKTGPVSYRLPPPIPDKSKPSFINSLQNSMNKLIISKKPNQPLPPIPTDHDYEEIQASYQLSPKRPAPKPPALAGGGTLSAYTGLEGVPFTLNPSLKVMPELKNVQFVARTNKLNYDFQLERQTLCTLKSTRAEIKNPFFK